LSPVGIVQCKPGESAVSRSDWLAGDVMKEQQQQQQQQEEEAKEADRSGGA
jgi:hypothetical protein